MPRKKKNPNYEENGRPVLLNPESEERFFYAIKLVGLESACKYAGLKFDTVCEWIRRGKGEDEREAVEPYINFANRYESTVAESEIKISGAFHSATFNRESKANWQAAKQLLGIRFPQKWSTNNEQKIRVFAEIRSEKMVEEQINLFFERIMSDEEIDAATKVRIFSHAKELKEQKEKAGVN